MKLKILTLILLIANLTCLSDAAIILSDNFESYTVGSQLGTNATWGTFNTNATGVTRTIRNQTTSTAFGSSNRYLELGDTSGTAGLRVQTTAQTTASNALTTFQFDFFEPTGDASALGFGLAMNSDDLNTGGSRIRFTLNNGTIGGTGFTASSNSYSLDTAYTMMVTFNDTASSVDYGGGTIAAGTAHVWFKTLVASTWTYAGSAAAQNTQTASYSFGFRSFNADTQQMNVDNFSWYTGAAAIPEPSVALLSGVGLLALLRRQRNP